MKKQEEGKTNRKGKERQIIQIRYIHKYSAPKSTSESQAH